MRSHTLLNKLEPVPDITLIRNEKQSAIVLRLARRFFIREDFRPKGNAAADDAADLGAAEGLEVGSGVRFADVGGEGTAVLGLLVVWEDAVEAEVVVAGGVGAEFGVVFCYCDVDGCTCLM